MVDVIIAIFDFGISIEIISSQKMHILMVCKDYHAIDCPTRVKLVIMQQLDDLMDDLNIGDILQKSFRLCIKLSKITFSQENHYRYNVKS